MTSRDFRKKEFKRTQIRGGDRAAELEREYKKHKRITRIVVLSIIGAIVLFCAGVFVFTRFHRYSDFEVKWEKELSEGSFSGYEYFGENVVKYSHDGASYLDKNGSELWVDTYEMNNPHAYVAGDYICIYDAQGNLVRTYDRNGQVGSATTILAITKACISEAGNFAVVVEDSDASYIDFYTKDGTEQDISIKTRLAGEGYPIDISLSPEGTQLISAFAYLDGNAMRTKTVFYDFSEIGKNIPNRLVGAFEESFADSMLARVRFINSTYSYAAADTGIYFFSSKNLSSPEIIAEITSEEVIEKIFNFKNHVGVVYSNHLVVYKADGTVAFEKELPTECDTVVSDGRYIYFISSDKLTIINTQGTVKYDGPVSDAPKIITSLPGFGAFIFAGTTYIKEAVFK